VPLPPSLKNIYKEIQDDLGIVEPNHGYLQSWADQGVLMLNTTLTVEEGKPNSHSAIGWQKFTDKVIEIASRQESPIVFLLWGRNAISKTKFIDTSKHLVLTSVHPSPLSAYGGFFGCKHFSKCNKFLAERNIEPINWKLPE
jgi:uracil-DNA glycosylase